MVDYLVEDTKNGQQLLPPTMIFIAATWSYQRFRLAPFAVAGEICILNELFDRARSTDSQLRDAERKLGNQKSQASWTVA